MHLNLHPTALHSSTQRPPFRFFMQPADTNPHSSWMKNNVYLMQYLGQINHFLMVKHFNNYPKHGVTLSNHSGLQADFSPEISGSDNCSHGLTIQKCTMEEAWKRQRGDPMDLPAV